MSDTEKTALPQAQVEGLLLPEYRQLVDTLFAAKSSIMIPNCSVAHATIINELIVKHTPANGDVYFFSDKFDKNCFENEDFIREVGLAVERGVKFHLACTGTCESERFKEAVGNAASPKENVLKLWIRKNGEEPTPINFSTNGTAVRLEKNSCKPEGDVSGNDPGAAQMLIHAFDAVCSKG